MYLRFTASHRALKRLWTLTNRSRSMHTRLYIFKIVTLHNAFSFASKTHTQRNYNRKRDLEQLMARNGLGSYRISSVYVTSVLLFRWNEKIWATSNQEIFRSIRIIARRNECAMRYRISKMIVYKQTREIIIIGIRVGSILVGNAHSKIPSQCKNMA